MAFHPPRGFRKSLLAGNAKIGVLVGTASEQIVELAAARGFDYVFLDGEHGDGIDAGKALSLIRAADAFDVPTIVRVPENSPDMIQQVLDSGALGICVPHVRTREQAERAVRAAKFPPVGERAMSPNTRACGFASGAEWAAYWPVANEETVVIVIVEDRTGVSNLEEISSVPGVDVVWVGSGDLSQDIGVAGMPGPHPEIEAAVARGLKAALANGKATYASLSTSLATPAAARREQFERAYKQGHRFFCATDAGAFNSAITEISGAARAALAGLEGKSTEMVRA